MARRFWGDDDPVGKRFRLGSRTPGAPWLTVAGVVGDMRQAGLGAAPFPELYMPFTQTHPNWARPRVLFIRMAGDPSGLVGAVKSQIWSMDKDQTIYAVRTMEEIVDRWLAPRRFNLLLLGVFAALALALTSVGIYGVISYAVSQRSHELGLRMALGAGRRDILKLIVGQGLRLAISGVSIGLIASLALTRWLKTLLFDVSATDPLTFGAIALLLLCVALLACLLPALRATKIDPMITLRSE